MSQYPKLASSESLLRFEISPDKYFVIPLVMKQVARWFRGRCANGYHEPPLSRLVVSYMSRHPRAVFVDVGALFGYFGILAHVASGGMNTSIFFEMNPESFGRLRRVITANRHLRRRRLRPVHAALSDTIVRGRPTSYLGFRLTIRGQTKTAPIDFLRLDAALGDIGVSPNLTKIDVEGFEEYVLRGMSGFNASGDDCVLVELHNNALLAESGSSRIKVLKQAMSNGYRVYMLGRHRTAKHEISAFEITEANLSVIGQKLDSRGDDLVALTRRDIIKYWPEVQISTLWI